MSPWGAITAALIAGFIAFIGMIITKENKTSEFRQEWIISLRENLAKLYKLYGTYNSDDGTNPNKRKVTEDELNEVIATIKLHLNHGNPSVHEKNLHTAIHNLNMNTTLGKQSLIPLFDELTEHSHLVLKEEWKRVKKGEDAYCKIKDFLFYIISFCISLLAISLMVYAMIECGILSKNLL